MSNTDSDWEKWGQIDPYYAVVSHKEFRANTFGDSRAAFFAGGAAYVTGRIAKFEKYFGPLNKGRALDFGCGVGRLVLPLAEHFDEAVGIDISDSMLAEATKNASSMGIENIRLAKSDDQLSHAPGLFDFVISFIVLQHIPRSQGIPILQQLLDRVAPGGGISLHFSVFRNDSILNAIVYWARRKVPGANRILNFARGLKLSEPLMQMNEYPLAQILATAAEKGFPDMLVDVEKHGNVLTATISGRRLAQLV